MRPPGRSAMGLAVWLASWPGSSAVHRATQLCLASRVDHRVLPHLAGRTTWIAGSAAPRIRSSLKSCRIFRRGLPFCAGQAPSLRAPRVRRRSLHVRVARRGDAAGSASQILAKRARHPLGQDAHRWPNLPTRLDQPGQTVKGKSRGRFRLARWQRIGGSIPGKACRDRPGAAAGDSLLRRV